MPQLPIEANLLVTSLCNLHCRHCTVTSHGPLNRDISVKEWGVILDRLAEAKILRLTVTGGEPFSRPDLSLLMEEMMARPFRFTINTNGTLLSAGAIDSLLKARNRIDDLMIGLDGASADTVDALRGEGTFERQMEGLQRLADKGIKPGFYCTVTSINREDIRETVRLAERYGRWIKFNPFVVSGPSLEHELALSPIDYIKVARELEKADRETEIRITGVIPDMLDALRSEGPGRWPSFGCGALRSKISVMPNGDLAPCDHLPALRLGNLLDSSVEDVLSGDNAREVIRLIDSGLSNETHCRECLYKERCIGGCPVVALLGESADKRDPYSCLALLSGED